MNMLDDMKEYLPKRYIGRRAKVGGKFGYIADNAMYWPRSPTCSTARINFDDGTETWCVWYMIELFDDDTNNEPLPLPG